MAAPASQNEHWRRAANLALALAILTIVYNLIEGVIAVYFGASDEALTLFGFGVDSFIEVLSGIAIIQLILRLKAGGTEDTDRFEAAALRITGTAFFILVAGLGIMAVHNIITAHRPTPSIVGVIIAAISIATMGGLMRAKQHAGRRMGSAAVLADANCTKTCLIMSVILLVAAGAYTYLRLPYVDAVGALGLAFYSFREGRECFEKAREPEKHCGQC